MSEIRVAPATADQVRPLRNVVLRWPGYDEVPPYDLEPTTRHVAAVETATDGEPVVLGVASVFPAPLPAHEDGPEPGLDGDWQLRGMAVDPLHQGRGIGRRVVEAAVEAARADGARRMWANARVSALPFYASAGWSVTGPVYVLGPQHIDHRLIHREV